MNPQNRFRRFAGALCASLFAAALCAHASALPSPMPSAYTKPMPFDEAVLRLQEKTPVAAKLTTADWQALQIGFSDRAFFSAQVDDIRTVATMQAKIGEALDLSSRDAGRAFMDRDKFIADMRGQLGALPGDSGDLTDLTSARRLGLVYDFQVEDAMEYGRWKVGQDADLLDAFPAQELVRLETRVEPRDWPQLWREAGGIVYPGERLVARKDDRIWYAISDFGRPWPPFKFGSGMGVDDVDRDDAVALKVIGPDDVVQPQDADFNRNLQASLPDASPALLEGFKQTFGDQVDVGRDGKIVWQGERIANLYRTALADPVNKWSLDLGGATAQTVAQAEAAGADLAGARLVLTADDIRHAYNVHGPTESRPGQRPLTPLDFKLVPYVWREPDLVRAGHKPGTLELRKTVAGQQVVVAYDRRGKAPRWGVRTVFVKAATKEKGGA